MDKLWTNCAQNIKSFKWSKQKGVIKSVVFVANYFTDFANNGELLGTSVVGYAEEAKEDLVLPRLLRKHDRATMYLASGSRIGGNFLGFLDTEVAGGCTCSDLQQMKPQLMKHLETPILS